jgi:hypothetical protein
MTFWDVVIFLLQAGITFIVSTLLFDALHYLLHRWVESPNPFLRTFSRWHWVHHKFLDLNMKVHPELVWRNLWFHVLPEYGTSMAGTLLFLLVFPWPAIALVAVLRTVMLVMTIKEEGMDFNHMAMDRVSGKQSLWWVGPDYHAMHHIFPNNFYSSFTNVFDLIVGTTCQIEGRKFLLTGANGAFGSAMKKRLEKQGGIVETAKSGVDFAAGDYDRMREKLERAEVLILAHGAKTEDCWNANYTTFADLIDLYVEIGKERLTPPEVWALGSEVELHGDFGMAELKDYSASKKAFAARARNYYRVPSLLYRHIVPSAFTSAMGKGPMSAATAVSIALFLIRRGFTYVPVTFTTLALWNYFRFLLLKRDPALKWKHWTASGESGSIDGRPGA